MKQFILILAVLLTLGCATGHLTTPERVGSRPTMAQAQWGVQYYIEHVGLPDPNSVQVRNIQIAQAPTWRPNLTLFHGLTVSGWEVRFELNRKNKHGDYIGFRRRAIIMMDDGKRVWFNPAQESY